MRAWLLNGFVGGEGRGKVKKGPVVVFGLAFLVVR